MKYLFGLWSIVFFLVWMQKMLTNSDPGDTMILGVLCMGVSSILFAIKENGKHD